MDLGQRQDYTAVAVVERWEEAMGFDYVNWAAKSARRVSLRHLERVALGTPYGEVAQRVRELTRSPELMERCTVVADATGVGGPVMELLRGAELGCALVAVTITGSERATRVGREWRVRIGSWWWACN